MLLVGWVRTGSSGVVKSGNGPGGQGQEGHKYQKKAKGKGSICRLLRAPGPPLDDDDAGAGVVRG